ncbi:hypothetical protein [Streptomyces sp. NPDC094149]|uniref:hypothetical protein n=1 Tax=Streptomyces sp. NPDC094149 TaxID=3155079 RepID=UPI00332F988E
MGGIAPGLAQLALTLAEALDEGGGATAKANAGRELRAVMETLRKLAPVDQQDDGVDKLAKQGEERRVRARRL